MVGSPLGDVTARIASIQARFPVPAAPVALVRPAAAGGTSPAPVDFASALAKARTAVGAGAPVPVPAQRVAASPGAPPSGAGATVGARAVDLAKRHLGVPYLWGGTTPAGFDCSGLIQTVYRELGVELPRVSRDQARAGQPVASLADARPGDLVAFGEPVDHIGIYAGNGEMVVAPHTGAFVRVETIRRTPTAIRRVTG